MPDCVSPTMKTRFSATVGTFTRPWTEASWRTSSTRVASGPSSAWSLSRISSQGYAAAPGSTDIISVRTSATVSFMPLGTSNSNSARDRPGMIARAAGRRADQAVDGLALVGLGVDDIARALGDDREAQSGAILDHVHAIRPRLAAAGNAAPAIAPGAGTQAAVEARGGGELRIAEQVAQGLDRGNGTTLDFLEQRQARDADRGARTPQRLVGAAQGFQQAAHPDLDAETGETGADHQRGNR